MARANATAQRPNDDDDGQPRRSQAQAGSKPPPATTGAPSVFALGKQAKPTRSQSMCVTPAMARALRARFEPAPQPAELDALRAELAEARELLSAHDAIRAGLEAERVAQPTEPVAWRNQAAAWLLRKAAEQAVSNAKWPAHAEAYPSWTQRVNYLRRLAEELQAEQEAAPFGVDAAPKFQHTYCSQCGGEFGPGNAGFSHCEDHAAPQPSGPSLVQRLRDEADLCRNETADDIAALLDEAASALTAVPEEATIPMLEAYGKVIAIGSELDGSMVWRAMLRAARTGGGK